MDGSVKGREDSLFLLCIGMRHRLKVYNARLHCLVQWKLAEFRVASLICEVVRIHFFFFWTIHETQRILRHKPEISPEWDLMCCVEVRLTNLDPELTS